jgi:DNA-3-methyladenine glycosylase
MRHTTVPPEGSGGTVVSLGTPFPASFYDRDPRLVARELLGATLVCDSPDGRTAGVVVETEAYLGEEDPACHAVVGRTARTWHLFGPPGTAYVYRIYGMHWCVNAVTLPEGVGSAVLLRAVRPIEGLDLMRRRRPRARRDRDLTNGPGKLCAAFGIDGALDGALLGRPPLSLRVGERVPDARVEVTPRIGITRAADLPYRYLVRDDPFVSPTPSRFTRLPFAP